jgi:branched-chain amino acid transport system substrate-binding protein
MKQRAWLRLIGSLAALAVITSACGNRQSTEDVRRAAEGPAAATAGPAAPVETDTGEAAPAVAESVPETGVDGAAAGAPAAGVTGATARRPPAPASAAGNTATPAAPAPDGRATANTPGQPAAAAATPPAGARGGAPAPVSGAPAAPAAPAKGPLSPVAIGSVGTLSGVVGQSIGGGSKAVQAWAEMLNDRGGLAGHPVRVYTADDGGDPARHQALVQELVESKGVIAFVYNAAPLTGHASVKYLEKKRVPVIGTESTGRWTYESPMFFPQATSGELAYAAEIAAAAVFAVPQGKTKLGLIACSEGVSICEDAKKIAPTWAKRLGYELVQTTSASLAQPDFTAECLSARNAGVQVVSVTMDANSLVRIAKSCASVGYKPLFAFAQQIAVQAMAREPALEGAVGDAITLPWFLADHPAIRDFQDALRERAPGQDIDGAAASGWASAKLFELAAAAISAEPTPAEILEGLWSIKDETLGGLTMPLTFRRDQPAERRLCYFALQISGGRFTSPDHGQLRCYDGKI